jgi:hypothetical protein
MNMKNETELSTGNMGAPTRGVQSEADILQTPSLHMTPGQICTAPVSHTSIGTSVDNSNNIMSLNQLSQGFTYVTSSTLRETSQPANNHDTQFSQVGQATPNSILFASARTSQVVNNDNKWSFSPIVQDTTHITNSTNTPSPLFNQGFINSTAMRETATPVAWQIPEPVGRDTNGIVASSLGSRLTGQFDGSTSPIPANGQDGSQNTKRVRQNTGQNTPGWKWS